MITTFWVPPPADWDLSAIHSPLLRIRRPDVASSRCTEHSSEG